MLGGHFTEAKRRNITPHAKGGSQALPGLLRVYKVPGKGENPGGGVLRVNVGRRQCLRYGWTTCPPSRAGWHL